MSKLRMYKVHGEPVKKSKKVKGEDVELMASRFEFVEAKDKKEAMEKCSFKPVVRAFEILDKMKIAEIKKSLTEKEISDQVEKPKPDKKAK